MENVFKKYEVYYKDRGINLYESIKDDLLWNIWDNSRYVDIEEKLSAELDQEILKILNGESDIISSRNKLLTLL